MKSQLSLLIVLAFCLLLAACKGKSPTSTDDTKPNPDMVSKEIGSGGGEIASADGLLTLSIPSGALSTNQTITITPVKAGDLGTEFKGINVDKAYELGPDGQKFNMPVTAQFKTGQNPVVNSDSIEVESVALFTSENGKAVSLDSLMTIADIDKGTVMATGQTTHFSPVVISFGTEFGGLKVKVSGVPYSEVEAGSNDIHVHLGGTTATSVHRVFIANLPADALKAISPEYGQTDITVEGVVFFHELIYRCPTPGEAYFSVFVGTFRTFKENGVEVEEGIHLSHIFECKAPSGGGTGAKLAIGVYSVPAGLSQPEAAAYFYGGLGNFKGKAPTAVSGKEGTVVFDAADKSVLLDRTDANSTKPLLGVTGVSQPNPGSNTPAALFSYGQDPNGGISPMGGELINYDPQNKQFSEFTQFVGGSYTDAVSAGGGVVSDEIVTVSNLGVDFIRYNPNYKTYEPVSGELLDNARFGHSNVVSAYADKAMGPVLVATWPNNGTNSRLYYDTRHSDRAEKVGDLGMDARKIRCETPVCAATLFGDDALQFIHWDGLNSPSITGAPVPVGDGPVDLDLFGLSDGNILTVTTGFNDDTFTLTKIDPDGALLTNTTIAAPEGCKAPGHAIFIANTEEPDNPYILATCFDSDNYAITDTKAFETVPKLKNVYR